jgi:hypothetical protein
VPTLASRGVRGGGGGLEPISGTPKYLGLFTHSLIISDKIKDLISATYEYVHTGQGYIYE